MILAVAVGNTNVRMALKGAEGVLPDEPCPIGFFGRERLFGFAEKVLAQAADRKIDGSIISSVVPQKTPEIKEAIISVTGAAPLTVNMSACGRLDLRSYDGRLGEDRAVCCAQALRIYEPPFIVIDFGTATTFNVVNGRNEFMGGMILAGVRTGLNALSKHTAQLPQTGLGRRVPLIASNTEDNLTAGAAIGAACAVEGYAARVGREMGRRLRVIVTGGNAEAVLPYLETEYLYEPTLMSDGLFSLYNEYMINI